MMIFYKYCFDIIKQQERPQLEEHERMRRKFCTNVHSLTLKIIKCSLGYIESCFKIFERFVDNFYEAKPSLFFSLKVIISVASFDAWYTKSTKTSKLTSRFDECCESSRRLYKQLVR